MNIIRFVFAPFFWLRDIRNSLAQIKLLLSWKYCMDVRYSPLSTKRKQQLLVKMLEVGKKQSADADSTAADILKVLELSD